MTYPNHPPRMSLRDIALRSAYAVVYGLPAFAADEEDMVGAAAPIGVVVAVYDRILYLGAEEVGS